MKTLTGIVLTLIFLMTSASGQGPFLDKMSLNIHLRSHRGQAEWRWTPKINFNIGGTVADSAKVVVEITDPARKSLFRIECSQYESGDIKWRSVSDCGNDLESTAAATSTGAHDFQIKLANTVLYSGKFTVGKYLFNPARNPAFSKNFYYYIDYDWRLPIAFIGTTKDEYSPARLAAWVWIKADQSEPHATAQLVYKGRTVAETTFGTDMTYGAEENEAVAFSRLRFRFNALVEKPEAESDWFRVYENPGEYEIRVLRRGALARVIRFSVGRDGRPVDSGVGKEITQGHELVAVPVKMEGTTDGALNPAVLKSGWWGNPISGLTQ